MALKYKVHLVSAFPWRPLSEWSAGDDRVRVKRPSRVRGKDCATSCQGQPLARDSLSCRQFRNAGLSSDTLIRATFLGSKWASSATSTIPKGLLAAQAPIYHGRTQPGCSLLLRGSLRAFACCSSVAPVKASGSHRLHITKSCSLRQHEAVHTRFLLYPCGIHPRSKLLLHRRLPQPFRPAMYKRQLRQCQHVLCCERILLQQRPMHISKHKHLQPRLLHRSELEILQLCALLHERYTDSA